MARAKAKSKPKAKPSALSSRRAQLKAEREAQAQREARAERRRELAAQRKAEAEREARAARRAKLAEEKRQLDKFDFKGALLGEPGAGVPGLRSLVEGLGAREGFNLKDIDRWTLKQKRRVRDTFEAIKHLEAQPKKILRPRSKEALKKYQQALHADVNIPGLKVAFYPYVERGPLKGAKRPAPRVRLTKDGVTITDGKQSRLERFFDLEKLATDTEGEIARTLKSLGNNIGMVTVQVGEFETLRDTSIYTLAQKIRGWMLKYNGVTPFTPADGRKFWDRPEQHHYSRWLRGLVGYRLGKGETRQALGRRLEREFKATKAKRKAERDSIKGKGRR